MKKYVLAFSIPKMLTEKIFYYSILILLHLAISDLISQDAISKNGMVATAHPLATKAGLEILEKGGNSIDAIVAAAFTLGVVEPNASGIGGGGFMTLKLASEFKGVTIDFREKAPSNALPEKYYQNEKSFKELVHSGGMSIGIPGTVAGLSLALENYGSMTLAEVLEPAINYAESGFEVTEKFSNLIFEAFDVISENEATSKIYLNNGLPKMEGERINNPDLAKTLRKLGINGSSIFYQGELAEKIVDEIQQHDGIMTIEDLNIYKAEIKDPIKGSYRGYEILSSAPPTGGGTHLVELLNILEAYNLQYLKHNSSKYIHLLAEAMKIVYADKKLNMADPAYYKVPVEELTSKMYAAEVRKKIDLGQAQFNYKSLNMLSRESNSTTHLSVVDKDGNIAALTQSINHWFGSGVTVKGTGILLNNHIGDFENIEGFPNSIEPNKKPVSSIAPTLVLKEGKPFLSLGTPGGSRIIGALAQIIINIIDFDMSIDDAIEAPRVHTSNDILHLEGRIAKSIVSDLEKIGHTVKLHTDYDNYFGGAQGILIDYKNNELRGGADSRRDGVSLGY